jgi:hypothetical protein
MIPQIKTQRTDPGIVEMTTKTTAPNPAPKSRDDATVRSAPKGTFWSRHNVIINFWLDVLLLVLFMVQAWMFAVLHAVFPRGAGPDWKIWGGTPLDWSESLFVTFCIFSVAIVVHVMFHWSWVCAVVATRIFGRKPGKDDGSHTLIGVGLIVLLVHLLAVGILVARVAMKGPA